jgi:hypothetical protein
MSRFSCTLYLEVSRQLTRCSFAKEQFTVNILIQENKKVGSSVSVSGYEHNADVTVKKEASNKQEIT